MPAKLNVEVLGQTYAIKCPPEAVEELKKSLVKLNAMCDKLNKGEIPTSLDRNRDRLLVMAGINLASQLIKISKREQDYDSRVQQLNDKLDLLK